MWLKRAAVQGARLGIEAIQDGVVTLVGGEYRAVLEVSATASLSDDDAAQDALLAGFAVFLNALSYPVQILVRGTPVDLSRYVTNLQERAHQLDSDSLVSLAREHAAFVQALAHQRVLLDRRCYVVVPAESPPPTGWTARFRQSKAHEQAEPRREAARRQLTLRCQEVARQLARCGLLVRRLADLELAHLYLACWSPERARAQRFRQQLEDYTTLAVAVASADAGGPG